MQDRKVVKIQEDGRLRGCWLVNWRDEVNNAAPDAHRTERGRKRGSRRCRSRVARRLAPGRLNGMAILFNLTLLGRDLATFRVTPIRVGLPAARLASVPASGARLLHPE